MADNLIHIPKNSSDFNKFILNDFNQLRNKNYCTLKFHQTTSSLICYYFMIKTIMNVAIHRDLKGIRQWPINICTSPMIKHKIPLLYITVSG